MTTKHLTDKDVSSTHVNLKTARMLVTDKKCRNVLTTVGFLRVVTKRSLFKDNAGCRLSFKKIRFRFDSLMRVCKRLFNSVKRVIVLDDVPPESNAMLQALYSRSPESVVEHLKRVNSVGPEKFMKSYYVGYAIFLIARI